jgi:hypothetical protein
LRGSLSSADRAWARSCVRVMTEGGRVLGSASPTPSPTGSLPGPTASVSPTGAPSPTGGSQSPSPTPSPSPSGTWPGPANTGVPAGTTLTAYTGPCTITTAGTVVDAKTINCDLDIRAANITISRSLVHGTVTNFNGPGATLTVTDTEIDGGAGTGHAIGNQYITTRRINVHGRAASFSCAFYCDVADSWLHGQYMAAGGGAHLDGVLSNGGMDNGADSHNRFVHNTIACDNPGDSSGGCSGDVGLFGDFAPLNGYLFDRNLFVSTRASNVDSLSYCFYGGANDAKPFHATSLVVTGNVWQRGDNGLCGHHGPVADYEAREPTNVWSGNTWDDGTPLQP